MASVAVSWPRAAVGLLTLTAWCVIMPACFYGARLLRYRNLQKIPMVFHRGCCRILGLDVHLNGELGGDEPTLFVSNHISYLDVFVLGGLVPGSFIAKAEVANWPVFGALAKIQNTLFFERRGGRVAGQLELMRAHFDSARNLILFPEGTSTPGTRVEPFKSSLFHGAEQTRQTVTIQPLTIAYTRYQGRPLSAAERDCFAWYATMPFVSHLITVLGLSSVQVELIAHAPVKLAEFADRKECALYCQRTIANALRAANRQHNLQEIDRSAYFNFSD